jgi:hypothetical protein
MLLLHNVKFISHGRVTLKGPVRSEDETNCGAESKGSCGRGKRQPNHGETEENELGEIFMAGKNTAVFGIYRTPDEAENGVHTLIKDGFRTQDISLLLPENFGTKDFAHEKNTKAPEGAATGAGAGAAIGGTLGLLAGIGALAIPGLGPFIAAGPIMGALAGIGAGGVVGGFIGTMVGMGIPEYEAKRYEGMIRDGGILVSVHCDNSDLVKRAKQLLENSGATDVASAGEKGSDYAKSDKPMVRHSGGEF